MKNIDYRIGTLPERHMVRQPFDEEVLAFLNDFSEKLLHDREARRLPDVIALAYWCRRSNIQNLKERECLTDQRIGRGLVFHITPSNIPVNFAFSYCFSLLAGNSNLVRIPAKNTPQRECILRVLKEVLEGYSKIKEMSVLVEYENDIEITEDFSALAEARIIWGGDETVTRLKAMRTKPRCLDICFADRHSIAVLDGSSFDTMEEEKLSRLVQNFYNDTYSMDQNACSSPCILFWMNTPKAMQEKFWDMLSMLVRKKYHLPLIESVNKYCKVCETIIGTEDVKEVLRKDPLLVIMRLEGVPKNGIEELKGRCGLFYECDITGLEELEGIVTEKLQTLTYYGIPPAKIEKWILEKQLQGIDRVVPFGQAMDIDIVWDGYDLIRTLSRTFTVW